MAPIDLKHAIVYIQDGYTGGGGWLVNNANGYTGGAVTMTIDGGTQALVNGDTFTVVGETGTPTHTITAHSETLGITTSITFTPALAAGVTSGGWLVNNVSGYTAGTVTIAVDGGSGVLAIGTTFTIAGETGTPVHRITAHSETLGSTSSITFTPAIASGGIVDESALSIGGVADDAIVTVQPHTLQIKVGEGNLTYSEKRKIKYILDRGLLDTVKEEDQEPVDVKLDFTWEFLRSAQGTDPPTPEEAFKKVGNASTWVSSSSDLCEIYAVDVILLYTPPCAGVKQEQIILPDFRWEDLAHDPKTSQIAVTGKCNVVAAIVSRI